jgi:hypothetical protein
MGVPPDLVIVEPAYCVATWGPMTIARVDGCVTSERFQPMIDAAREQCRRWPDGGGFSLLVGSNRALPGEQARALIGGALREMASFIHAAAVVIEGDGFFAATARSVISLLFMATRQPVPMRVFANVQDAALWQAGLVRNRTIEAAAYARVLADVTCEHHAVRRAPRESSEYAAVPGSGSYALGSDPPPAGGRRALGSDAPRATASRGRKR